MVRDVMGTRDVLQRNEIHHYTRKLVKTVKNREWLQFRLSDGV